MPTDQDLIAEWEAAHKAFLSPLDQFMNACQRIAFARLELAFPTLQTIHVFGDDEGSDFSPRLRVQRLTGPGDVVLYDVEAPDAEFEDLIDDVGVAQLDWLIEHSNDWYGENEIAWLPTEAERITSLLSHYASWHAQRSRLWELENTGELPSPNDWQGSDDRAVELLNEFASVLGAKTSDVR